MRKQGNRSKWAAERPRLCWVMSGVTLLALLAVWGVLLGTRLLPPLYLVVVLGIEALIVCAVFFLTRDGKRLGLTIAGSILMLLAVVGSAISGFFLWQTVSAVQEITGAKVEHSQVNFYVAKDSPAQSIYDLAGSAFGILKELDRSNTDAILEQMKTEYGLIPSTKEFDNLIQLADALQSGVMDVIVLNEAYLSLYEETPGYEDFPNEIKAVSTLQVEHVVESEKKQQETDPIINILISGSDTRDSTIDQRGRSDVNIIASVNTETKQILLISTPRDYYVPLDVGVPDAYDKLTHAGIYGMDVLTGTLENLYKIDIDYYFRINFTGFVDVVDALGGIDVYSAYDFTAENHHYVQGMNSLDGEEALNFARERYAFSEGDRQRGSNQMEVLKAVFHKAMSPSILTQYLSILNSVQGCVDTNIPYEVLSALVRQQLETGDAWTIESFSVNGTDDYAATYSMNQSVYVMIPDENTITEARDKLAAIGNVIDHEDVPEAETGAENGNG